MHTASCRCGALTAECSGDPVRISVCHCLECQRRSGSVFAAQARFPEAAVTLTGPTVTYRHAGGSGKVATFLFCPTCGATLAWRNEGMEGTIAIPTGAFADPSFPAPNYSVYEGRKHPWVEITAEGVEHFD